MRLTLSTPPTGSGIDLAAVKEHLRIETVDDDTFLTEGIAAVSAYTEEVTNRALLTQTWELALDGFPHGRRPIVLPKSPLISVGTITFVDFDGTIVTWSPSLFRVIPSSQRQHGFVEPVFDESYPSSREESNAVKVTFNAGYGANATDVEAALRVAMHMIVAHLYENREPVVVGATTGPIRLDDSTTLLDRLLAPHRVFSRWSF